MADQVTLVTPAPTPAAAPPAPTPTPAPAPAPAATTAPPPTSVAAAAKPAVPAAPAEPSVATPDSAPAAAATPAAAPAEAPKPAEGTPQAPKTSLLAEAGKTETPAPASSDAAPVTEAPAEAAPLPTYDALSLPEGVTLDKTRVGEFDGLMGRFEQTHGVSHEATAAFRQELTNFYIAEMQRAQQAQHENWNRTREGWRSEIKDNPTYGKTRLEATLKDVAAIRDRFATPQFLQMIEFTGAGDHPGMIETFRNIAQFLDKHGLLREGRPLATTIKPVPQQQSRSKRRYANGPNMNGAA